VLRAVIRVLVPLGDRSYEVVVGRGVRKLLPDVFPPGAKRAAIVTQDRIPVDLDAGLPTDTFVLGDGEQAKTLASVADLCSHFTRMGLTRADAVVALGGGLVTDVAGFAAAVYHRGTPVVHVPTTLLAMVDAAIGGKTGVNLPEGKNLVGAFWQPAAVLCDTELLDSLPEREWRSGYGEMAKYHFLTGEDLGALALDDRIARCVAIKAEVVAGDEREDPGATAGSGGRALLNYGHTLAHALEIAGRHDLRHGEAVGIGLVFAAELAHTMERVGAERVAEHREVVASYGLDTELPGGLDGGELLTLMARDKKAVDGLTFVLDGPRGIEVVKGVDRHVVASTLARLGAP
jgi:5-deoxy-5-amino-3-dehydroquinate synthase